MKITLLIPALVAILGLALAGVPMTAQAQPSTSSKTDTSSTTDKKYTGKIKAISAKSITIEDKKKTMTFAITPKTKFKKDKVSSSEKAFVVGDKVTVTVKAKKAKSIDLHKSEKSSHKTTS